MTQPDTEPDAGAAPEPVVKHLRRETIVDDERVDKAWEEQHADKTREKWDAEAPARNRRRLQERQRHTLGERLDSALAALTATSAVGARPAARSSKSADPQSEPGPPSVAPPAIEAAMRMVAFGVAEVERELDAQRGLIPVAAVGRMTSEAKDRQIWEAFMGCPAELVAEYAPWLGKNARTIMCAREREAQKRRLKVNRRTGVVTGRVVDDEHDREWAA